MSRLITALSLLFLVSCGEPIAKYVDPLCPPWCIYPPDIHSDYNSFIIEDFGTSHTIRDYSFFPFDLGDIGDITIYIQEECNSRSVYRAVGVNIFDQELPHYDHRFFIQVWVDGCWFHGDVRFDQDRFVIGSYTNCAISEYSING